MSAPPAAGGTYKWQCKHCAVEIPDLPRTTSFSFCPTCNSDVRELPDSQEDTVASNQGRQGSVDAEAQSRAGIPEVGLIMDTQQSPPTAGLTDPSGGKSSSESSGTELYPKLVDMDTSFGSCSLSDQSSSTQSDEILPKKRQLDDSQHIVSELQKKKCDSEGPSSPTSLPNPTSLLNPTSPPKSSPMQSQSHRSRPSRPPPPPPSPKKESGKKESAKSDRGSAASSTVTDSRKKLPGEHSNTPPGVDVLDERNVEEDGRVLGENDGFTLVGRNRNRANREAGDTGGDQMVFGNRGRGARSTYSGSADVKYPPAYGFRSTEFDSLTGIHDADCIAVTFNVVIPREFWLWDDKTEMHLRFGDRRLGNFRVDVGTFKCFRDVGFNKYWMQCTLNIGMEVIRYGCPVAYKYVIHSPRRAAQKEHPYEFLHQSPRMGGNINRTLQIPNDIKTKFSVYDGMIFPEKQPSTIVKKIVGAVTAFTDFFTGQESEKEPVIPNHEQVQEQCLHIFLENHRRLLTNLEFSRKKVQVTYSMCVDEIHAIFEQLRVQNLCRELTPSGRSRVAESLARVLKTWLLDIVKHLKSIEVHSPTDNGRRMCSVLVVLAVLSKASRLLFYNNEISRDEIIPPFSMLRLCQEPHHSLAADLNILMDFVPEQHYVEVARVLAVFTNKILPSPSAISQWVYVIPLIHIFRKKTKPFQDPALVSKDIMWSDADIQLTQVKPFTLTKISSFLKENYASLEPVVVLDPLLLPLLVNVCHSEDLPEVFAVIPTYLSVARLLKFIQSGKGHLNIPEVRSCSRLVQSIIDIVISTTPFPVFKEATATFGEIQEILRLLLTKKISSSAPANADLVHLVVSLLFHTSAKVEVMAMNHIECVPEADQLIGKMWSHLTKLVEEHWIVSYFTPTFGEPGAKKIDSADRDIQDFEQFAKIDCPTPEIQERWCTEVLHNILKKRVARVPQRLIIQLVVILERLENPHPIVSKVFLEAVEEMLGSEELRQLYDSTDKYRKIVGSVLSKMFAKQFPHGLISVSMVDLLNWESWPVCISIYKSEMRKKSDPKKQGRSWFSDESFRFCSLADDTLTNLIQRMFNGLISLKEMETVVQKKPQVLRLCAASAQENLPGVKSALEHRHDECTAFRRHKEILGSFCRELKAYNLDVEGLSGLSSEIVQDHSLHPVNSLCCIEPSHPPQFICFQSAKPLEPILNSYHILSEHYRSDLFKRMWMLALKTEARTKLKVTFADVVPKIWTPVFTQCCRLLDSIQSREIQLRDVDEYFHQYNGGEEIFQHLRCLYSGIEACNCRTVKETRWIRTSVDLMEQYWALCGQAEAANIILDLKRRLYLTGNFQIIEYVAGQVTESMKDAPLDSIRKLIDAKSFLEELTTADWKLECLRQFAACSNIVEWIRKETKEVNDLHKFVSVALHTAAGEGDLSSDRLSHLKMVGSGFGPLIYGLAKNSSFELFWQRCKEVWTAVAQAPKLPKYLAACNDELEWYKSVKETQASVEITSFGQMNNIFQYGCYTVGSGKSKICQDYHEVIHLALKEKGKRLTKQSYNLEELRDLESKLVLITGSKAENRASVDVFIDTLHSICRIAEVLLTLQQVGNVKYTGWTLRVPCSKNVQMIIELQKQAKEMEDELLQWNALVSRRREEFYELNYFNTMQLLTLRRELGKLGGDHCIAPDVLALLQGISSEVSPQIVSDTVHQVTTATPATVQMAEVVACDDTEMEGVIDLPTNIEEEMSSISLQLPDGAKPRESPKADTNHFLPNLTEDNLTETQKEMMVNISSRLNCSKQLVLTAFEECPGESDRYDYESWCFNNLDKDILEESEDEESEPGSDSDSEIDLEGLETEDKKFKYSSSTGGALSPHASSAPKIVVIEKAAKEAIDENNAIVADLVSAGYTLERSMDAVDRYGTLDAALEHLGEEEEDDEPGVIPSLNSRQYSREDSKDANMDWEQEGDPTICADPHAERRYLSLEHLGEVLKHLGLVLPGEVRFQRTFPTEFLKEGYPNLIVVQPDHVLRTTLSLYMEDHYEHPLPTPEEVLICNSTTNAEEIELFWMRTINDPGFRRIFCLVHAEKLTYQVSDLALTSLSKHSQGGQGYRLVIISSNEEEATSHFISKLHLYRRPFISRNGPAEYRSYLAMKLTRQVQEMEGSSTVPASIVDCQNSSVRIVSSDRSGMGKSLYIQRLADSLAGNLRRSRSDVLVTIPLHGPAVTHDIILEFFMEHLKNPTCCIYHIDIAPNILWKVDTILFSLLILRGLCDSQGRVWRCHPHQLYAVELTKPNRDNIPQRDRSFFPEICTLGLLDLLPSVSCLSPRAALGHFLAPKQDQMLMDTGEFESSPYQRVYQYIRRFVAGQNLDSFSYSGLVEGTPQDCVGQLLHYCGVQEPSWSEIRHFVRFLDLQLKSCEQSVFTDHTMVGDVMAGLKGFVVKFMIRMSRDFSTSSLQGEVALEMRQAVEEMEEDDINIYQISERKRWEQNPHPYIFFNRDGMSITFVGFTVNNRGDLIDPVSQRVLEGAIMTPSLYKGLLHNRVNFADNHLAWTKDVMIVKVATVMGLEMVYDPDPSYVLTVDNVIKILAIQMRFRCGIPVVIMGETGCGKTRLIRYMCDLARQGMDNSNMLILKVHGGTTEKDIADFIQKAEQESEKNRLANMDTVVFFDEANTTDAIGLIKEIMCDHRINGKPVSGDLKFIAACNPYRKHSEKMIRRLESAGLGFFVRETEKQQKLGKIPLRQLVYRVLDLPPSMRPLVYDFGQLNTKTEDNYIQHIVLDHIRVHPQLSVHPEQISTPMSNVLTWSQAYMRAKENECSFVSLRDVERAMIVFEYLYKMMKVFGPLMDEWAHGKFRHIENEDHDVGDFQGYVSPGPIARALVLSLSLCYHARLEEREEYENGIINCFTGPIKLPGGPQQFRDEIRWCQEVLLDKMILGENIARNAALRENVFMMAICVELRIPLFLVGKPGSSKSLAKSIISESMKGKDSKNELLKNFKEVEIFSYQCSQLSTPDSVIEVFHTASNFQKKQDKSSYVAVVVLDEVGLAEDSPNLPLKALHPLLEDGTEGAKKDYTDQIIDREERVAFIGISNWALDPAKMNRGVMVTRGDPSEEELVFSAKGICSNKENDPIRSNLETFFQPFARAYKEILKKQEREFFGLRDFYSMIKMLYYMCEKSRQPLTWPQLEHAIKRNFGGLESQNLNPFQEFESVIIMNRELPPGCPEELLPIMNPDCSRLGLIKTSLDSRERTWHGENRYVLFLTENYAALDILKNPKNYLSDEMSISTQAAEQTSGEQSARDTQPYILFGSSFPKDKEYTQVCRNINQIKICMETGRTVILLNLENLYESLYDVLNQYYIYHADSKYVDLGLQTHRVRCRVDDNFKLILIAEKDTVYDKFPTPLINRLEKHFVLTSSILEGWQETVLGKFQDWIRKFSNTGDSKFKESDAFIGFQKDTPASVVFQATHLFRSASQGGGDVMEQYANVVGVQWNYEDMEAEVSAIPWEESVLDLSKFLLLQTAAPDAIVRLERTDLAGEQRAIEDIYFRQQHHSSIEDFLIHHVHECDVKTRLLMQVTTHSHLLSHDELKRVEVEVGVKLSAFFLHEFDTELDFTNKISPTFKVKEDGIPEKHLVIIQCDSGHMNGDLIACARYRIYDLKVKADKEQITHVLFIIHLPHQVASSSFVGFQGNPWISFHIDDLRPTTDNAVSAYDAIGLTISELFLGRKNLQRELSHDSEAEADEDVTNDYNTLTAGTKYVEDEQMPSDPESIVEQDVVATMEEQNEEWAHDEIMETEGRASLHVLDIEDEELEYEDVKKHEETPQHSAEGDHEHFLEHRSEEGMNVKNEEKPLFTRRSIEENNRSSNEEVAVTFQPEPSTTLPDRSPLYCRLHGCIQAAASKLRDITMKRCTKRVEILVRLIPKDLPSVIDATQFHGVLIQHIFNILQQRDDVRLDEKQWVVKEAMNPKSLQHGGTFRNVLSRKVDEVVIPIFSEIISVIDQNYNLNLIDPKKENTPLSQFWLQIFNDAQLMQFNYTNMVAPREQIPGLGGRKSGEDFMCELPFSWLVFEAVNSQWDNAKSAAGTDPIQLYNQLSASMEPTTIGGVLNAVDEVVYEEFYRNYLHDFVRLAHRCKHKNQEDDVREYGLIAYALDALVHGDGFCSVDGNITLLHRIAALHVVDQMNLSQIMWFSQLVSLSPGIMVHLNATNVSDKDEMILHLVAVEQALNSLTPPLNKTDPACNLIPWLNEVRAAQNVITSIITLPRGVQASAGSLRSLRSMWASIQTMQSFLEHVLLKHDFQNSVAYLIRLQLHFRSKSNFLEASTLKMVQSHLNRMEKEVKSKKLIKGKELRVFKKHCQNYFLEVVSSLCFGGQSAPEEALIRMLMEVVFTENATREITHVADAKTDEIPVVRSSLLQLLLEHDSANVKEYLEEYFAQSQRALRGSVDQNLYLLCIQCFEDALSKQHRGNPLEQQVDATIAILDNSHHVLRRYKEEPVVNIGYLEGVAGMRFAMMEVATLLHTLFNVEQDLQRNLELVKIGIQLLQIAEEVCTDFNINTTNFTVGDAVGPAVYLLKLLVRQYGFDCLKKVSAECHWVVPEGLRAIDQETVVDPFVIYKGGNFDYPSLRESLCDALFGKQLARLEQASKDLDIREGAILLLSIYEGITLGYSSTRATMDDDLREAFSQFILNLPAFSLPMRETAHFLLSNEQGGPLAQLCVTPELPAKCKTLGAVVVHTVAVLGSSSRRHILLPFINMMTNPAALANAYMPTMPEDPFVAILQALKQRDQTGRFCVCPRGHRYFIGNCGGAVTVGSCNVCGSAIGGQNYNLVTGNRQETDQSDKTKTGHALGSPESRTATPAPERFLSPPAVCIVRAIMHSALLWCSCHREDVAHDLAHLVKPFVNTEQLPEFFWTHLSKDIEHLSRVTGKGVEDSAIIVHLVLSEILRNTAPDSDIIATVNSLNAKNAREHWEREFNTTFIQPVLGQLDDRLNAAMDAIGNDDKQEHDQLFYLAYERVRVEEHSIEPHLWSYRQRVSLEHLGQTLQEKKLREKYPILHEFLHMEPSLRATQYLPDIVKLQRSLYDAFNHRLDRNIAKTHTIDKFLRGLRSENSRNEYRERIASLKKAFALVGNNLKTHSRLPLEEQHCPPAISEDIALEYLIPTTSGAGVLTTSLVDYLILTHNNFIEKCCGQVAERSQGEWVKHKVPITHIHRCHLLDYEHQIVSVVLSHCRYSLRLGEAHTIQYDHQALEKHVLDKFIYGKPIILSDIPQVVYRRDIYTTVTFNQVRKNFNPQEKLEPRVQREILSELRTPDRIRENLDVVDIVLGFLSSGGGRPSKPLGEYVDKVLKMKRRPFSQKAREYCQLKHVLSLWRILSVELSRQTWLRNQEPFDSVHIKYLRDLSEEDVDDQKKALDGCLRAFDLDRLLGALFEFVETHVKHSPDNELNWPVRDIIVEDQFKHLDVEEHFYDEFPESITLDQTVAVWKHIVEYQERLKQE